MGPILLELVVELERSALSVRLGPCRDDRLNFPRLCYFRFQLFLIRLAQESRTAALQAHKILLLLHRADLNALFQHLVGLLGGNVKVANLGALFPKDVIVLLGIRVDPIGC